MTTAPENLPFAEALRHLGDKTAVGSRLTSQEWRDKVAVALRERAFFSARIENARVLQTMQDYIGDFLSKAIDPTHGGLNAQGRAEFVAEMRELCQREGLGKLDPTTGKISPEIDDADITDIRSIARLQLIFDTQTEQAYEYGYWEQGNDPDILDAYPAQRFIRVRPVKVPRPYHAAAEGTVRRKDDLDFWLSMNPDFGVPYGPWGFNSGMGVEDVGRREAQALGLIEPGEKITPPDRDLNTRLSASVRDFSPEIMDELRQAFQKQVEVKNGRAWWAGDTPGKDIAHRGTTPTPRMRDIIADYTRSGEADEWFGEMNRQLREENATPEMTKKATALKEALATLPNVRATVWRDTGDIGPAADRYQVGEQVIERFFISTTKDKNLEFLKNPRVLWRIDCLSGKDIHKISLKKHQNEVLIPTDLVFTVLEKKHLPDERLYIHLREEP